jgi:hypothetical protein
MGFCNNPKSKIGKHNFELAIYDTGQLVKIVSTDNPSSVSVIEEMANDYITNFKRNNPEKEYQIVKFYKSQ